MSSCKSASLAILSLLLSLSLPLACQAQYATCIVSKGAHNRNRVAMAPVSGYQIKVECNWPHSVPFGIWGVSSNVGGVSGKDQFQGWWDPASETAREWNSCTNDFPPPNCSYYNHAGCTQQISIHGENGYGGVSTQYQVSCPRYYTDGTWRGGCEDLNGYVATLGNNFMTIYEKDWPDGDDLVQTLYFPPVTAPPLSCDVWSCASVQSPWVGVTSTDDPVAVQLVDAEISIRVNGVLFETAPYGDCDQFVCPPCDPVTGCAFPCIPTCFLPPC